MGSRIRLGILGGGGDSLIGVLHRVASAMYDKYQIVGGVFNPNWEENIGFAKQIGLLLYPGDLFYPRVLGLCWKHQRCSSQHPACSF